MLILRRKEGQWVEVTHQASGETVRIRVYNIRSRFPGQLDLAFDDPDRNFAIQRPERGQAPAAGRADGRHDVPPEPRGAGPLRAVLDAVLAAEDLDTPPSVAVVDQAAS